MGVEQILERFSRFVFGVGWPFPCDAAAVPSFLFPLFCFDCWRGKRTLLDICFLRTERSCAL